MLPSFLRYYMHGNYIVYLFTCILHATKICMLFIQINIQINLFFLKQVGIEKLGESNLHHITIRPMIAAISNCFVLYQILMLTMNSTKHLLNLFIFRTVPEKNIWFNYSYDIDMNEYANI